MKKWATFLAISLTVFIGFLLVADWLRGPEIIEDLLPAQGYLARQEKPSAMLSIWNNTTGEGDLIVEMTYLSEYRGTASLVPLIRRVNLGSGGSVAGFYPAGVVNLRAGISSGKTVYIENLEMSEGSEVRLLLTKKGFERR